MTVNYRWRSAAALAVLLVAACACGPATSGAGAASAPTGSEQLSGEVLVFAAASLSDAFGELGTAFEKANPATTVIFNFAGSQTLAGQIRQGAPAAVLASANTAQMEVVAEAGLLAGQPQTFAANELAIAVEPGNPLGIEGLEDLRAPEIKLVMAAEEVPAGRYARQALDDAGLDVAPVSLENDVRAVLSKVALGEADAGIVYRSDVVAAGDNVEGIEIPAERNVVASYPIAVLAGAGNPALARAFVDLVQSKAGEAILQRYGFSPP